MKKNLATLFLAAGILADAVAAGSATVRAQPSIAIANFGEYRTRKTGDSIDGPRTAAGRITELSDWRLVKRTNRIFGQLGREFGVEIDLSGFGEGPVVLTVRTLHPPLINPATGRTTGSASMSGRPKSAGTSISAIPSATCGSWRKANG